MPFLLFPLANKAIQIGVNLHPVFNLISTCNEYYQGQEFK
jgi:hypothetical protein